MIKLIRAHRVGPKVGPNPLPWPIMEITEIITVDGVGYSVADLDLVTGLLQYFK